jgi:hypothetical protein
MAIYGYGLSVCLQIFDEFLTCLNDVLTFNGNIPSNESYMREKISHNIMRQVLSKCPLLSLEI